MTILTPHYHFYPLRTFIHLIAVYILDGDIVFLSTVYVIMRVLLMRFIPEWIFSWMLIQLYSSFESLVLLISNKIYFNKHHSNVSNATTKQVSQYSPSRSIIVNN